MAQKVSVELVDDLDGTPADETVAFALDGTSYEVDLNAANAAALREVLAPYIGVARRTSRARPTAPRPARAPRRRAVEEPTPAQIREWGREHGFAVSARGRVSAELAEAYAAAH